MKQFYNTHVGNGELKKHAPFNMMMVGVGMLAIGAFQYFGCQDYALQYAPQQYEQLKKAAEPIVRGFKTTADKDFEEFFK